MLHELLTPWSQNMRLPSGVGSEWFRPRVKSIQVFPYLVAMLGVDQLVRRNPQALSSNLNSFLRSPHGTEGFLSYLGKQQSRIMISRNYHHPVVSSHGEIV